MATRLPHLDDYLAALPEGLASHADCAQKGSIQAHALAQLPGLAISAELPPLIRERLATPPLPTQADFEVVWR